MTASEAILNYATRQGGVFNRKDLLLDTSHQQMDIKDSAVTLQINRMIASGTLRRMGRGKYELIQKGLPEYVYQPSEDEKSIFIKLKQQFPLLDMCIWSPSVLALFMLHVPDIGYTFVDVEKDGMETVFHALQAMELGKNILLSPSPTDCERYLTGSDAIVVRQLIGQSPLTVVDGCVVPRIEKILVDLVDDNELFFASGSETYTIYEFARERNNVNMSKLLRYASRRSRKEKVVQIIKTIEMINPGSRLPLTPLVATHPGEMIKDELKARGMTPKQLATETGINPSELSDIIDGKRGMSPSVAVALERVLGISASTWMNMQTQYDLDTANIAESDM